MGKLKFCDNNKCVNLFLRQRCIIEIQRVNKPKKKPSKTLKCSRSKTIRPRKLKRSHHVDLMRSRCCELFSFLCLIVLGLEHFKVLGGLVYCCFTLYSHFMVCFFFFVYTTPTLLKYLQWMLFGNFFQNSRKTKKF